MAMSVAGEWDPVATADAMAPANRSRSILSTGSVPVPRSRWDLIRSHGASRALPRGPGPKRRPSRSAPNAMPGERPTMAHDDPLRGEPVGPVGAPTRPARLQPSKRSARCGSLPSARIGSVEGAIAAPGGTVVPRRSPTRAGRPPPSRAPDPTDPVSPGSGIRAWSRSGHPRPAAVAEVSVGTGAFLPGQDPIAPAYRSLRGELRPDGGRAPGDGSGGSASPRRGRAWRVPLRSGVSRLLSRIHERMRCPPARRTAWAASRTRRERARPKMSAPDEPAPLSDGASRGPSADRRLRPSAVEEPACPNENGRRDRWMVSGTGADPVPGRVMAATRLSDRDDLPPGQAPGGSTRFSLPQRTANARSKPLRPMGGPSGARSTSGRGRADPLHDASPGPSRHSCDSGIGLAGWRGLYTGGGATE